MLVTFQAKIERLILCVLLITITVAHVLAQDARTIAKSITPSVVLLVMQDDHGQPLSLGSGFVAADGIIVTNWHVVDGSSGGYAKLCGQTEKFPIKGTVGFDTGHDLAILSVPGFKVKPLPLGDSSQVAAGDTVYVVGNPQGLEGTFSAGIISGIRKVGADSLLQITAPISPGSSGGPVTDSKGEVIGVSVATFKDGQNLNFAIPSAYIASLLAKPTPVQSLVGLKSVPPSKSQHPKSILDDLGGKSTEGVVGQRFTWDQFTQSGDYSFTFKNNLQIDVKNIVCLVVFYDESGAALDVDLVQYPDLLPAGLAKRVTSKVDGSVEKLNTRIDATELAQHMPPREPKGRIEFRVLYFQSGDSDQPIGGGAVSAPAAEQPHSSVTPLPDQQKSALAAKVEESEDQIADAAAKIAPAGDGPDLIESSIDGDFQGWDGETIFKLANGQIWQQVSYSYTYHYAFSPKVTIVKVRGVYKLKVDGVDDTIFVKQLK